MDKHYLSLIRSKILSVKQNFRILYYRLLGMEIGKNVLLGKVTCEWPNKIEIGDEAVVENNVIFKVTQPFNKENFISVGKRVFVGAGCQFNCNTRITISDDCLIASNTIFVDTGHEINKGKKINLQGCVVGEITLMEDVWIGTNCKILKGVTIGRGSIIGAGSLVNKSIPEYQIWAGTPARFIKDRI